MRSRIIEYLEKRDREFEKVSPLLELFGASSVNVRAYKKALTFTLDEVRSGKSDSELSKEIEKRMLFSIRAARILYRDILTFIETGSPLIPESLLDLPAFIKQERTRLIEEEKERSQTRSRMLEERIDKEAAEKRRKEQLEIADRLGIRELITQASGKGNK